MPNNTQRKCGVKPQASPDRCARVETALRTLEKIGAAFTIAEVAERAGVSRATIYRDPQLRALVGTRGDVKRPVDPDLHTRLQERHESLKTKARDLRGRLSDLENSWEEMRQRALNAEERARVAEQRLQALSTDRMRRTSMGSSLENVAVTLGPTAVRQARRQLARALHPDLFAQDPAAAALATELLKTLNALAE